MSWRIILYPFALLYSSISGIRNLFFDHGLIKSVKIPFPSIVVGNLSVGGTGKSPHVIYLANHFLDLGLSVSILSRGYGRITKGAFIVNENHTSSDIGDEQLQYKSRFGNKVTCVVAEKRQEGINLLIKEKIKTDILLLDDAFQHRFVIPSLSIVISKYKQPFFKDFVLPAGNLRESRKGIRRADMLIYSNCPNNLDENQKTEFFNNSRLNKEKIFFSSVSYGEINSISAVKENNLENVLLVTGIASPDELFNNLKERYNVTLLAFKDHHSFSNQDLLKIEEFFGKFAQDKKAIITTEKDYMRLLHLEDFIKSEIPWYYQAIEVKIENETEFIDTIKEYVREN